MEVRLQATRQGLGQPRIQRGNPQLHGSKRTSQGSPNMRIQRKGISEDRIQHHKENPQYHKLTQKDLAKAPQRGPEQSVAQPGRVGAPAVGCMLSFQLPSKSQPGGGVLPFLPEPSPPGPLGNQPFRGLSAERYGQKGPGNNHPFPAGGSRWPISFPSVEHSTVLVGGRSSQALTPRVSRQRAESD